MKRDDDGLAEAIANAPQPPPSVKVLGFIVGLVVIWLCIATVISYRYWSDTSDRLQDLEAQSHPAPVIGSPRTGELIAEALCAAGYADFCVSGG